MSARFSFWFFFFFNDTATTEIYTLSLHDALPISRVHHNLRGGGRRLGLRLRGGGGGRGRGRRRSEEHTSELQSQSNLVCRLLLEKKKKTLSSAGPKTTSRLEFHTYSTPVRRDSQS